MFSWGIYLFASDTHTIYDAKTKKLLNWGKEIIIGDNVWVAMDCTVLKNSFIAKIAWWGLRLWWLVNLPRKTALLPEIPQK